MKAKRMIGAPMVRTVCLLKMPALLAMPIVFEGVSFGNTRGFRKGLSFLKELRVYRERGSVTPTEPDAGTIFMAALRVEHLAS